MQKGFCGLQLGLQIGNTSTVAVYSCYSFEGSVVQTVAQSVDRFYRVAVSSHRVNRFSSLVDFRPLQGKPIYHFLIL